MHSGPDDAARAPIFETSSLGMIVVSLDAEILQANEAAAQLLGRPLADVVGSNALEILDQGDRALAEERLDQVRAQEIDAASDVYRFVDPSGRERWLATDTTVLQGSDGQPEHSIVFFQDVSDHVHLQRALDSSSTSLEHLVEHAPVAILSVSLDATVRTWNPAAEDMFGWSAAEVVGGPLPILPEHVGAEVGARLQALVDGEEMRGVPLAAVHRDGHTVHTLTSAVSRRDPTGSVQEIIAFAIDVSGRVEAEQRAKANDRRFRKMVDNLTEIVAVINPTGRVLASTVFPETSDDGGGGAPMHLGLEDLLPLLHPEDQARGLAFFEALVAEPTKEHHDVFRVVDQHRGWAHIQVTAVNHSGDPDVDGIVVTAADVTRHKRNEALLADQAAVLELIARSAPLDDVLDAIVAMVGEHSSSGTSGLLLIEDGRLVVAAGDLPDELADALGEDGAAERFGLLRAVLDRSEPVMIADASTDPLTEASRDLLAACGLAAAWALPIVPVDGGPPVGAFATWFERRRTPSNHERRVGDIAAHLADIAIVRSRVESELSHAARFDQLTGLPNRIQLLEHLAGALGRAQPRGTSVAVMFLDLDRFKLVNDSLGHTVGDQLMLAFGQRLQQLVRPGDLVGRFEGDEFVVVLEDIIDERDIRPVMNRFELALSEPFAVEGGEVVLTASVGVALSTGVEEANTLLQNADVALVLAKERGRNTIEMFDDDLRARARHRLDTERDLRQAIERSELRVFYQPKIDLATGTILGAEALLRWFHPTRGLVGPIDFVPVAEDTGLITRIGRWVLEESLHQARTWLDRGHGPGPMTMSVNLSARQLRSPDLVDSVATALDRYEWDPRHLILELTESILIDDTDGTFRRLNELKDLGVRLAVDDFGTGYSSLSYLDQLPVDVVKIDRAFVSRLRADGQGSAIVTAVLHLAAELELIVLGEGVEEQHQLDGLRLLGCHWAQGFHFAKPLPSEEMTALLDTEPTW